MAPNRNIELIELPGLHNYEQAWSFQEQLLQEIVQVKTANRNLPEDQQQPTRNYLIFCQHPHVYTLGKSGLPEHLLATEDELKQLGATYHKINRGGDITYHGPGQIVGYPVLDLENFYTDIHRYLREIEEVIIRVLAHFGIKAGRSQGFTGVWIEDRKICAIGVRTSRWVTMHGFAFNINPDLSFFQRIVPCGIADKDVTSLSRELNRPVSIDEVLPILKQEFQAVFGAQLVPLAQPGR